MREAGAEAVVKRVAETVPAEIAAAARQPSENELAGARHQGELIARTAAKLKA